MSSDRSARAALVVDDAIRRSVVEGWPPRQDERDDGYLALPLERMRVLDAGSLDDRDGSRAVAVVADEHGATAALPLVRDDVGWHVAYAADGVTSWLVDRLRRVPRTGADPDRPGFRLDRRAALPAVEPHERALGTDQSHTSVVVGDAVIVKWRTALAPGGARALRLRRHLQEVDFRGAPPLLGSLSWRSPSGEDVVLADIDGYLEAAADGWDAWIGELIAWAEAAAGGPIEGADEVGRQLGEVTADLHVALRLPSSVLTRPIATTGPLDVRRWREAGLAAVDRAAHIEATDRDDVRARAAALRVDIGRLDVVETTPIQPIHGDLHVGQVVRWTGGLAIIDFDGPPWAHGTEPEPRAPTARDVAQMLCSLDHLAVVVDQRTSLDASERLEAWAAKARAAFLDAYRERSAAAGSTPALDERLLPPFIAEQLCRELIYAADVLPRWRYAPLGAMRWRYPASRP